MDPPNPASYDHTHQQWWLTNDPQPQPQPQFAGILWHGLYDGPGSWDLSWLLGARTNRTPRATHAAQQYEVRGHTYSYAACESPGALLPRRLCQLVQPVAPTHEMAPFLTHGPVAVVPRAGRDDPGCAFCGHLPVLHNVRQLCAFHFYNLVGARTEGDIRALDGFRDFQTGRYVYRGPDHVDKCRNLIVGSVPEARGDEEGWREGQELGPQVQTAREVETVQVVQENGAETKGSDSVPAAALEGETQAPEGDRWNNASSGSRLETVEARIRDTS
ncbi:hypothetical protein F4781DRAFT_436921 [Annulohypoxylon bovei var. microspora]|nr:hypothetical protein F4781DRAFT_436921 [Annulohypoxylon bovei var. microspora]